jgi:hypothetical protein
VHYKKNLSGTYAHVVMKVMIAVRTGPLFRVLGVDTTTVTGISREYHASAGELATLLLDRLKTFVVAPPLRKEGILLSIALRAQKSEPLWTAVITSMVHGHKGMVA